MKEEKETLASEMLHNLEAQNKRQQITIIALISVIVIMIIFFFSYESQYDTTDDKTYIEQTQDNTNNSSMIGEIN